MRSSNSNLRDRRLSERRRKPPGATKRTASRKQPGVADSGSDSSKLHVTQILIVDDHSIVRRGVKALLMGRPEWQICGEATNASEAVIKAKTMKPDIVIMDIQMPGMSGVEATRQILKAIPTTKLLVLSIHESNELVGELLEAGARGYVFKSDLDTNLVAAVEALQQGQTYFSSPAGQVVLDAYLKGGSHQVRTRSSAEDALTARQKEVVRLVVQGKPNKEVAYILGISVKTAETHRIRAMRKLGLSSLSDLVRYAVRKGFVNP